MSDKPPTAPLEAPATVGIPAGTATGNVAPELSPGSGAAPKAPPKQNEAFRMMGLPRLRLPSRNWLIFLSLTGSFASAVLYDKYQTRRAREKWCSLVSHIADEPLPTKTLPRRVTIYLGAPPGDGLRAAREHFHAYVKPVLVAAAMDWDVVEGRKEGDVRFKTAEKVRRQRRRGGEGEALGEEEYNIEAVREKAGITEWEGVGGDLVMGRNVWKEYVRGLHEGWLGPVEAPKVVEESLAERDEAGEAAKHVPGQPSIGDAALNAASTLTSSTTDSITAAPQQQPAPDAEQISDSTPEEPAKETPDPPKPRNPPPYLPLSTYASSTPSPHTPEVLGPATAIPFPHILGFRNTPTRIHRFLTRRRLADDIGRQVATAILAAHRPFGSGEEVRGVLGHEERDWWKTTFREREAHEEGVWIEECVVDERVGGRMRRFELERAEAERAERIGRGDQSAVIKRLRELEE